MIDGAAEDGGIEQIGPVASITVYVAEAGAVGSRDSKRSTAFEQ